jgi:phosphoglycerol transferase
VPLGRAAVEADHPKLRWAAALVVAVAQSGAEIYYAFFAIYFLLIAGILGALRQRQVRPMLVSGMLIAVSVGTITVNLIPAFQYWQEHGRNLQVANRTARETDLYAVRLASMLLPVADHHVPALATLRQKYDREVLHHYEVHTATLGCVASVGFIALLGALAYRKQLSSLVEGLSLFTLFGFICGTSGGLGMLFSLLILPQLRSQNRICVYLSFLALAGVAVALNAAWARLGTTRARRTWFCGALGLLVTLGVLDQQPATAHPNHRENKRNWTDDGNFVRAIEAALPAGAMVFQIPYARFPEGPGVCQHHSYYAMRYYLHSQALRWSSGAMGGRETDQWQQRVSAMPLDEQLRTIAAAGFKAVQVNGRGYPDGGAAIRAQLQQLLGGYPMLHADGQDCCFVLDLPNESTGPVARTPGTIAR